MGKVVKTLVTRWKYTVDASQVKNATKDLTKLRAKLLEVRKSSVTFGKQERNQLRAVGQGWQRATSQVHRYRRAKIAANRQGVGGPGGGGGFGFFGGGRKGRKSLFHGQSGRIATLASTLGAGALGGLAVSAGGAGGILGLLGAGAVGLAGKREQARASIGGLLGGDFDKADTFLNSLNDFAKKTPFQIGQLRELSSVLLASGFAAEEVIDNLRVMGDVTRGDNDKLNRMLFNFTQIKNQQRATALDLRQFAMAGIPIYAQLEKQLKVNGTQLRQMTRDGKVSFDVVAEALRQMTAEGGLFFRGMELQSLTLFGIFSNIKDAILIIGESIGMEVLPQVKELATSFKKWAEENQVPIIKRVKNIKESFGQFIDILKSTDEEWENTRYVFKAIATAITGMVALAMPKLTLFVTALLALDDVLNGLRGNKSISGDIVKEFKENPTMATGNMLKAVVESVKDVLPPGLSKMLEDAGGGESVQFGNKLMQKFERQAEIARTRQRMSEMALNGELPLAVDSFRRSEDGRMRSEPAPVFNQTNNISGADSGMQVLDNTESMLQMYKRNSRVRKVN